MSNRVQQLNSGYLIANNLQIGDNIHYQNKWHKVTKSSQISPEIYEIHLQNIKNETITIKCKLDERLILMSKSEVLRSVGLI